MINFNDIDRIDITNLTGPLKRVALIHDISGFGKASITVSLPILAVAGIEGICLPTALLSTHTGEFENFTYHDLTKEMNKIINHWDSFNLKFNAIYSGYLSSPEQVNILISLIKNQLKINSNLIVFVDPVMGDNGHLYKNYNKLLIEKNRELIKSANVIFPNMTESYLLLNEKFNPGPYSKLEVERVSRKLSQISSASIIITGIELNNNQIGISVFDKNQFRFLKIPKVSGTFHGTGDVFASFLIGAYLNNFTLFKSAQLSATLVYFAALRTNQRGQPKREGLDFEGVLPLYIKELESQNE